MQIEKIILYNKFGDTRSIDFNLSGVSIITGESKTGKSSLIDIIDYCLGSDDCRIAHGTIRDSVTWFSLLIKINNENIFIARKNPDILNVKTTSKMFYKIGRFDKIPSYNELTDFYTTTNFISFLTQKMNYSPNLSNPSDFSTRLPVEANFRHSLYYSFQNQSTIARRDILFYKQDQEFIPQTMKDTLPYLLGAIREDNLYIEQDILRKRRELRLLEKQKRNLDQIKSRGFREAENIINEAKLYGIIDEGIVPNNDEEYIEILKQIDTYDTNTELITPKYENVENLQDKLKALEDEYWKNKEQIKAAEYFARSTEGYTDEVSELVDKLDSIELFDNIKNETGSNTNCPYCNQVLKTPIPMVEEINQTLFNLRSNLDNTLKEKPRMFEYISNLRRKSEELKREVFETKDSIKYIIKNMEDYQRYHESNIKLGILIGKVKLLLESITNVEENDNMDEKISNLKSDIEVLESKVSDDEKKERLDSILNKINVQMSKWADDLNLEYKDSPLRLDLKNLTILVDTPNGPINLNKMGSGENWVSYHILTHLALHKHFIEFKRPTPHFIILDQPSQVYYPPEMDLTLKGEISNSTDEEAVYKMYDLIFKVVSQLYPKLQIIITDHADLKKSKEFQENLIENWRFGKKLIPSNWYE